MTADEQRILGRLEGQVESLTHQVVALNTKVDSINQTLATAQGGWKMLLLVGGAAGAVGGLIGKFLPFLNLPRPGG